jgi:hypothetical protein
MRYPNNALHGALQHIAAIGGIPHPQAASNGTERHSTASDSEVLALAGQGTADAAPNSINSNPHSRKDALHVALHSGEVRP